ncbi:MAG: hypothetical protein LC122_11705 [Chitinophagales bacterium]|nr:hypothetical protein [Chitinophagales bacterium]
MKFQESIDKKVCCCCGVNLSGRSANDINFHYYICANQFCWLQYLHVMVTPELILNISGDDYFYLLNLKFKNSKLSYQVLFADKDSLTKELKEEIDDIDFWDFIRYVSKILKNINLL